MLSHVLRQIEKNNYKLKKKLINKKETSVSEQNLQTSLKVFAGIVRSTLYKNETKKTNLQQEKRRSVKRRGQVDGNICSWVCARSQRDICIPTNSTRTTLCEISNNVVLPTTNRKPLGLNHITDDILSGGG